LKGLQVDIQLLEAPQELEAGCGLNLHRRMRLRLLPTVKDHAAVPDDEALSLSHPIKGLAGLAQDELP
jgi:hypothetical protein